MLLNDQHFKKATIHQLIHILCHEDEEIYKCLAGREVLSRLNQDQGVV